MAFIEVWNIETVKTDSNSYNMLLFVGIAFILIETIVVISRKLWGDNSRVFKAINLLSKPKYPYSLIFFPLGALAIIASLYLNSMKTGDRAEIIKNVRQANIEIAEGNVIVEFEQPASGRTKGDIIHINDRTFELSYYFTSDFYKKTIAQGGVLTADKLVRVHYIATTDDEKDQYEDGKIVKIEVTR